MKVGIDFAEKIPNHSAVKFKRCRDMGVVCAVGNHLMLNLIGSIRYNAYAISTCMRDSIEVIEQISKLAPNQECLCGLMKRGIA